MRISVNSILVGLICLMIFGGTLCFGTPPSMPGLDMELSLSNGKFRLGAVEEFNILINSRGNFQDITVEIKKTALCFY